MGFLICFLSIETVEKKKLTTWFDTMLQNIAENYNNDQYHDEVKDVVSEYHYGLLNHRKINAWDHTEVYFEETRTFPKVTVSFVGKTAEVTYFITCYAYDKKTNEELGVDEEIPITVYFEKGDKGWKVVEVNVPY